MLLTKSSPVRRLMACTMTGVNQDIQLVFGAGHAAQLQAEQRGVGDAPLGVGFHIVLLLFGGVDHLAVADVGVEARRYFCTVSRNGTLK